MDQYISIFEELATEADYDLDSKPVMNLFQKGLNYKLNNRIFSFDPPPPRLGRPQKARNDCFKCRGPTKSLWSTTLRSQPRELQGMTRGPNLRGPPPATTVQLHQRSSVPQQPGCSNGRRQGPGVEDRLCPGKCREPRRKQCDPAPQTI
jgi:hypothetical protein